MNLKKLKKEYIVNGFVKLKIMQPWRQIIIYVITIPLCKTYKQTKTLQQTLHTHKLTKLYNTIHKLRTLTKLYIFTILYKKLF
jgi:hypothetical protein